MSFKPKPQPGDPSRANPGRHFWATHDAHKALTEKAQAAKSPTVRAINKRTGEGLPAAAYTEILRRDLESPPASDS